VPDLRIQIENHDRHVIVRIAGQGALDTTAALQQALSELAAQQPDVVVLDLSGLDFAASLFMGTLVQFRGQLKQAGGSVRLACLQPAVAAAFERAQLLWIFPVFDSVEAALA
jgi:anti-anti-sigma factor